MSNYPFFTRSQYPRHPYYDYSPSPALRTQPVHHLPEPVHHYTQPEPIHHFPYYDSALRTQPLHHHPEPVHHYTQPEPVQVHQNVPRKPVSSSAPKVVRIPVQFANSDTVQPVRRTLPSRSESALKIQKVFRGFLVRKSLKKIVSIKKEVDEIEKKLLRSEFVELLKSNDMERLKVNEMLMGLLFKLDSIRGYCSGVRDCRKAVIKKAILLQERVDSLIATKIEETDQISDDINEDNTTEVHQSDEKMEDLVKTEVESAESEELDGGKDEFEEKTDENDMEINGVEEVCDEDGDSLKANEEKGRESERELLEKMMEENGKMMSLMNQLFERSEKQTQLLNSLTHRVEQLEKAVVCDKTRRKKKNQNHASK